MTLLHQIHNLQGGESVARGETRRNRSGSVTARIPEGRQPQSFFSRSFNLKVHLLITCLKRSGKLGDPGPLVFIRLEVGAPMSILIIASCSHHGNVGGGVGTARWEAQGVPQHRIVFVWSANPFPRSTRSPAGSPSSSFGGGLLLHRSWPALRSRHGQVLNGQLFSKFRGPR